MFKLKDAYHCSVLVAKTLDFESRSSYVLNITASNVSFLQLLIDLFSFQLNLSLLSAALLLSSQLSKSQNYCL